MFFNNKKNKDEEIVEEVKQEDFVISDYAMERYKKSEYYNQVNLTNKEIELLFCDKKNWDTSNNDIFLAILKQQKGDFSYIEFPFCYHEFKESNKYENCTFYGGHMKGESFYLHNCSIYNDCKLTINAEKNILLNSINASSANISITSCTDLNIFASKINGLNTGEGFQLDKINKITINRVTFYKNIHLYPNIDYLKIIDSEFKNNAELLISSKSIDTLEMYNLNVEEKTSRLDKITIKNLDIRSSKFSTFFDLEKITNNCFIDSSKINDFNSFSNSNLYLNIRRSELINCEYQSLLSMEAKNINIKGLEKTIRLKIFNTKKVTLSSNIFQTLSLSKNIENIFIKDSTIEEECSFTHLKNKDISVLENNTFKKGIDFKFASINKLAIYKSSFKKLDFDCSFINEARFSQVKGLNEANEKEEISDEHFASKESLRFFEKVIKG